MTSIVSMFVCICEIQLVFASLLGLMCLTRFTMCVCLSLRSNLDHYTVSMLLFDIIIEMTIQDLFIV